jgi:hypothetical protein
MTPFTAKGYPPVQTTAWCYTQSSLVTVNASHSLTLFPQHLSLDPRNLLKHPPPFRKLLKGALMCYASQTTDPVLRPHQAGCAHHVAVAVAIPVVPCPSSETTFLKSSAVSDPQMKLAIRSSRSRYGSLQPKHCFNSPETCRYQTSGGGG